MEPAEVLNEVPDELRGVQPRQRAFLVALVLCHGRVLTAAKMAGVSWWLVYTWEKGDKRRGRPPDPVYLEALESARELAADHLEDTVARRAIEGLRQYKFTKDGTSIRHPEQCECGHERQGHAIVHVEVEKAEDQDGRQYVVRPAFSYRGSCTECSCERFEGAPYHEDAFSDKLAELLLKGAKPEKYAQRKILSGSFRNINWDALAATPGGQQAIARLAQGEHPQVVFASLAEAGAGKLLGSGAVLGGPGTEGEQGEAREAGEGEQGAADAADADGG